MHAIYKRRENRFLSTFRGELIGSFILWIMILVGAAIASKPPWGNLSWCWIYLPCRVLTAMLAFAWLCFIFLTILIAIATIFAISNRAFNEPLHGRWDPRASHYGPSMSTRPTSYA
ncbi:hypothetical protein VNI00_007130 [Paramarasmius palmivorus]|uniref:Uncharacterized protein n=1 Tax=Paramarasmius palmivorus TaxID=297713 RepID=A0AAW0D4L6_9AGAR